MVDSSARPNEYKLLLLPNPKATWLFKPMNATYQILTLSRKREKIAKSFIN
jgi:hypothetical protein